MSRGRAMLAEIPSALGSFNVRPLNSGVIRRELLALRWPGASRHAVLEGPASLRLAPAS
jgi:hypothetical protein